MNKQELLSKDGQKFTGNYFQWLKYQFAGWDRWPWFLFGIAVGLQSMNLALNQITWISVVSWIATIFGSLCTVAMCAGGVDELTGKRVTSRAVNGLLGAISVVGFIIVNASMNHYFSIVDQLIFFCLIDVELMFTWSTWGRGKNAEIKKLSNKGYVYTVIAMAIAWGVLYYVGLLLNDQQPVWDSLVLAMGAVASWLCFRRYSLTYKIWLCSDVAQVLLFVTTVMQQGWSAQGLAMAMNYAFYFGTAIVGLINWKPTTAADVKD